MHTVTKTVGHLLILVHVPEDADADDAATLRRIVDAARPPPLWRKWEETRAATPGDPANVIAPALPPGFVTLAEYVASLTPEQRALMDAMRPQIEAMLADPLAHVCPSCGRAYE